MNRHPPWRIVNVAICIMILVSTSGCLGGLSSSDGDIVLKNQDSVQHNISITIDRGPSYDYINGSEIIEPDKEKRLSGILPRTDTTYAFYLYIYLDGEYVNTTGHQWDQEIILTIHQDGKVTPDEEEGVVEFTPEIKNRTKDN